MHSSGSCHFIAAVMAVLYGLVAGCSTVSRPNRLSPEQANSLANIKSIALMTPDVNIVRQDVAPGPSAHEGPVPAWAEKARRNIARTVVKQFGNLFGVKESDSMETADALLSVSASDEIKTASRRGMDTLGLAYGTMLLPLLYVTVVPMVLILNPKAEVSDFNRGMLKAMWPAGLTTIKVELRNPSSGEILWSFIKESRNGYDLRDYASVESLIAEAVEDLTTKMSRAQRSD
jgi:hypothetical protein